MKRKKKTTGVQDSEIQSAAVTEANVKTQEQKEQDYPVQNKTLQEGGYKSSEKVENTEDSRQKETEVREKEHGKNRIVWVLVVFLCMALLAVASGIGLALWDMGKMPHDLIAVMNNNQETATVDTEEPEPEPEVEESTENQNKAKETESIKEQETEQVDKEQKEMQPVQTAGSSNEIAHIATVVRAGGTDEMVSANEITADVSGNAVSSNMIDPNANYPLAFTSVDVSYFDDALFIGDSRMEGFGMRSGTNATFYATKGFQLHKYETMSVAQTEAGKVPIFDALPPNAFTKIYIKVGLNELGWGNDEKFLEKYAELIARLRENEPRAIIYIHGLLPVTATKSSTDSTHSNDKIRARNESLKQFAVEQKAYYIDINSVVSDTDGSLKPEMTTDGIHLKSQYMDLWREYLRTHAIVPLG